jgi:hypothetical protein
MLVAVGRRLKMGRDGKMRMRMLPLGVGYGFWWWLWEWWCQWKKGER